MNRRRLLAAAGAAAGAAMLPGRARAAAGVKIGVLTDMNAASRDMSGPGSVIAAKLAIADAGGSALGQPIELIVGDHQMKPDVGGMVASGWYDTRFTCTLPSSSSKRPGMTRARMSFCSQISMMRRMLPRGARAMVMTT